MNPDTNELVQIGSIEDLPKFEKEGFIPVPQSLERAAKLMLGRKRNVFVSKTSGGKLSKWAVKKRRERKRLKAMVDNCNAYYS